MSISSNNEANKETRYCIVCNTELSEYDTVDVCGKCAVTHDMNGNPKRKYVNVYSVERSYGGPEEGGWWYNRRYPETSIYVEGQPEDLIEETVQLMRKIYSHINYGDIYSVLGGTRLEVVVEPFRGETTSRQHYE